MKIAFDWQGMIDLFVNIGDPPNDEYVDGTLAAGLPIAKKKKSAALTSPFHPGVTILYVVYRKKSDTALFIYRKALIPYRANFYGLTDFPFFDLVDMYVGIGTSLSRIGAYARLDYETDPEVYRLSPDYEGPVLDNVLMEEMEAFHRILPSAGSSNSDEYALVKNYPSNLVQWKEAERKRADLIRTYENTQEHHVFVWAFFGFGGIMRSMVIMEPGTNIAYIKAISTGGTGLRLFGYKYYQIAVSSPNVATWTTTGMIDAYLRARNVDYNGFAYNVDIINLEIEYSHSEISIRTGLREFFYAPKDINIFPATLNPLGHSNQFIKFNQYGQFLEYNSGSNYVISPEWVRSPIDTDSVTSFTLSAFADIDVTYYDYAADPAGPRDEQGGEVIQFMTLHGHICLRTSTGFFSQYNSPLWNVEELNGTIFQDKPAFEEYGPGNDPPFITGENNTYLSDTWTEPLLVDNALDQGVAINLIQNRVFNVRKITNNGIIPIGNPFAPAVITTTGLSPALSHSDVGNNASWSAVYNWYMTEFTTRPFGWGISMSHSFENTLFGNTFATGNGHQLRETSINYDSNMPCTPFDFITGNFRGNGRGTKYEYYNTLFGESVVTVSLADFDKRFDFQLDNNISAADYIMPFHINSASDIQAACGSYMNSQYRVWYEYQGVTKGVASRTISFGGDAFDIIGGQDQYGEMEEFVGSIYIQNSPAHFINNIFQVYNDPIWQAASMQHYGLGRRGGSHELLQSVTFNGIPNQGFDGYDFGASLVFNSNRHWVSPSIQPYRDNQRYNMAPPDFVYMEDSTGAAALYPKLLYLMDQNGNLLRSCKYRIPVEVRQLLRDWYLAQIAVHDFGIPDPSDPGHNLTERMTVPQVIKKYNGAITEMLDYHRNFLQAAQDAHYAFTNALAALMPHQFQNNALSANMLYAAIYDNADVVAYWVMDTDIPTEL